MISEESFETGDWSNDLCLPNIQIENWYFNISQNDQFNVAKIQKKYKKRIKDPVSPCRIWFSDNDRTSSLP